MAHAASRQHGGGSLRRLLSKQTNPLNRKHGNPHRRAALLTNTFVPMVRRKEVADSRLSPGSKCRAERNRTGHRNCHPCRMGKVFRRGYHPQGWSPHRLGLPLLYPASEERQPKPETAGGSNFRNHPLCKPRLLYTRVTFKRLPQECSIETLSEGGFLCASPTATGKQRKRHGAQKCCPSEKR